MNEGNIAAHGAFGAGVSLASGGAITNQSTSLISGVPGIYGGAGGALNIVNDGGVPGGITLRAGGTITDGAGAMISGTSARPPRCTAGAAATVVNAGTDHRRSAWLPTAVAIDLAAGGAVVNQSGGNINAYFGGAIAVQIGGVGTITNQPGATISSKGGGAIGSSWPAAAPSPTCPVSPCTAEERSVSIWRPAGR